MYFSRTGSTLLRRAPLVPLMRNQPCSRIQYFSTINKDAASASSSSGKEIPLKRPSLLKKEEPEPEEPFPKEPIILAGATIALILAMTSCFYAILHDPRHPSTHFMARHGDKIALSSLITGVTLMIYVVRK